MVCSIHEMDGHTYFSRALPASIQISHQLVHLQLFLGQVHIFSVYNVLHYEHLLIRIYTYDTTTLIPIQAFL